MEGALFERFARGKSPTKAEETLISTRQILIAKAHAVIFYPRFIPRTSADALPPEADQATVGRDQ